MVHNILRRFWKTDLTLCIPAFQSASFIDRTIRCAQGQTYRRVRILIAVDKSTDETARICRRFRKRDPRIEILEHEDRLGWCANVNSLLERVDTPFFSIYFHDDLILPQYCEELRKALLGSPEAASAHCDVLDFGDGNSFIPGRTYDGSVAQRILTLWAVKHPGAVLRSMVRLEMTGPDFRLPQADVTSFTPGHILQMRMIAAGPAVRVPETLYLRWIRSGGLTAGWRELSYDAVLRGRQNDLAQLFSIVDQQVSEPDDRTAVKFALILYALQKLAARCRLEGRPLPELTDLHPDVQNLEIPANIERFGPEVATRLRKGVNKLAQQLKRVA